MAFANPVLLFVGLGLAAVPILLHLIKQQKPRNFIFPALRFVQERIQTNQRRLRMRHWLLLLVRCLAVLLIAFAFSQPSSSSNLFGTWVTLGTLGLVAALLLFVLVATVYLFRPFNRLFFGIIAAILAGTIASIGSIYLNSISTDPSAGIGNDQSPVTAVILIDTSPRMLYEVARESTTGEFNQSESRLAEAQSTADWLIRQLPDGSNVAVVDASPDDPFFSVDIASAAKRISALSVRYDPIPLPERLDLVLDFLENSNNGGTSRSDESFPREIYVFTDLTLESWRSKRSKQVQLKLADSSDLSVYLIDVGIDEPRNYQLDALELSSETVSSGGKVNLLARIFRTGPPGERPVQLVMDKIDPRRPTRRDGRTLFPDENVVRIAAASLDKNGSQDLTFSIAGLTNGIHHGVVRIQGADSLSVDNERYFTINVRQPWPVLLVRPRKRDETESAVADRIISVVLSPDDLVESGQAQYSCTTIDQEKLLEEKLSDYSAVLILDPRPMGEREWEAVRKYAEGGGGVSILLGENAKTGLAADPSFASEAALNVLGGRLGEIWTPTETYFSNPDYSHPIIGRFKRFETEDIWREFPVYQHWGLLPIESPEADVRTILRYSNQKSAIVDRQVGSGHVLTVTTPFSEPGNIVGRRRWNDLTTGEWWPAALLIDEMASYLVSSKTNRLNYSVGDNVVLVEEDNAEDKEFLVYPPRNEEPAELKVLESQIRYRFTETPGNYRLKTIGTTGRRRGFSVNLDREKTNLSPVSESMLQDTLGKDRYKIAESREDIIREQSYLREGKKFFPLLLTIFGVIILVEFLMSNRFYRAI